MIMVQSPRRKDASGRVLKAGESQRQDGRYMYRYTDARGKRHTVYAKTLSELREREDEIAKHQEAGLDYQAGLITVEELLKKYIELKKEVLRYHTLESYEVSLLAIQRDPFGAMPINKVKSSDVREFFIRQHQSGRKYSSIVTIKRPLSSAFKLAVDEDVLRKNPADIAIDFIPDDSERRIALTAVQQKELMAFVRLDKHYKIYYDEMIVLLDTGLRIGEFCGLTMDDLDFENRRIYVNHQLVYIKTGGLMIEKTKTKSGERIIPMTNRVYQSLQNMIAKRRMPKVEPVVDGYTNFLMINRSNLPQTGIGFAQIMRNLIAHYRLETGNDIPNVTPHVLRHTFCTNLVNAGIDVKTVQYLMGHANVKITLDIYAHSEYSRAEDAMKIFSDIIQQQ